MTDKELQEKMHTLNDDLNDEQKEAMYKMMISKNCFITGVAGTGKGYVVREIKNKMRFEERQKND